MKKNMLPRPLYRGIVSVLAVAVSLVLLANAVQAATLTTASVSLSDPRPSTTTVTYDFLASNISTGTSIKCVKLLFSANADGTGGVPTGMDTSVAAVAVNAAASTLFSSHAGWTLNKTTNGSLLYTNSTGAAPSLGTAAHFVVNGITNGSQVNVSKFLAFSTYTNTDCVTGPTDSVTTGFIFTDGQQVSMSVDAALTFAVAGIAGDGVATVNGSTITNGLTTTSSTIPFTKLSSSANRVAAQDLTVSTNSGLGYTVSTRYTGVPTSGSYTIPDLATATNASPLAFSAAGTAAFGYTTSSTTLGTGTANRFSGGKWAPFTTTNAEVAYNNAATAGQTTRIGLQAGISGSTAPGSYTTTVIYTATPLY
ncbi:MAG: hypothetical protein JWM37_740 [Candidatus Saccharibacteria bacterium]|nr:hypothetical protein [Candidatus Saccharibacteria bacterium]